MRYRAGTVKKPTSMFQQIVKQGCIICLLITKSLPITNRWSQRFTMMSKKWDDYACTPKDPSLTKLISQCCQNSVTSAAAASEGVYSPYTTHCQRKPCSPASFDCSVIHTVNLIRILPVFLLSTYDVFPISLPHNDVLCRFQSCDCRWPTSNWRIRRRFAIGSPLRLYDAVCWTVDGLRTLQRRINGSEFWAWLISSWAWRCPIVCQWTGLVPSAYGEAVYSWSANRCLIWFRQIINDRTVWWEIDKCLHIRRKNDR